MRSVPRLRLVTSGHTAEGHTQPEPFGPVDHYRAEPPSWPALIDPPPWGSPRDLAGVVLRQADELAAIVEHCRSIDVMTSRILLRSFGEMHVLLDELQAQLLATEDQP